MRFEKLINKTYFESIIFTIKRFPKLKKKFRRNEKDTASFTSSHDSS